MRICIYGGTGQEKRNKNHIIAKTNCEQNLKSILEKRLITKNGIR